MQWSTDDHRRINKEKMNQSIYKQKFLLIICSLVFLQKGIFSIKYIIIIIIIINNQSCKQTQLQ